MPELPEVEVIRRGLERYLVGKTIEDVEIRSTKQFIGDRKQVIGVEIRAVRRFGKGLVVDFCNGFSVVVHLKMTGQLLLAQQRRTENEELRIGVETLPNKWTRAVFKLRIKNGELRNESNKLKVRDGYSSLYYNDIRKFGWIRVVKTDQVEELPFFKSLGHEPLRDLDLKNFGNILASSKAPIKSVLMDQHKISGIGNIYANEALFLARINPMRPALSLSKIEAKRLFEAIEEVLKRGIEAGGSSMTNYVNALGEKGRYQEQFLVYGREGEKCLECKGVVRRIKMGGRGTFYCYRCQK